MEAVSGRAECVFQASDYKSVLLMLQGTVISQRGIDTDGHLPRCANILGREGGWVVRSRREQEIEGARTAGPWAG